MNQLIIKLTGKVNSTNFEEWKKELISQIKSTKVELICDKDFVDATEQVKSFKAAEQSLKQAKQSAIDHAEEIQALFSAIDEVSEEARQARLLLEHQIKARKLEIKNQYIQSGIDEIQEFINEQVEDFKYIDQSTFLNRHRFESAVRGKAGLKGLQSAISKLCAVVKNEVSIKVIETTKNKIKIDTLPEGHKLLFQDRKTLLCLSENELSLEMDKRITKYNEEAGKNENGQLLNAPKLTSVIEDDRDKQEKYKITIDLLSTKTKAMELARSIKDEFISEKSIYNVKLTRNYDD